jgi:citrate lyase beta subunit
VRPDLAGLGVPEELRSTVVRAAELMARRPRIGAEDLAASLGVPDAESRRARTFAELLLAQAAAARRRRRGARPSDGQFQPMA